MSFFFNDDAADHSLVAFIMDHQPRGSNPSIILGLQPLPEDNNLLQFQDAVAIYIPATITGHLDHFVWAQLGPITAHLPNTIIIQLRAVFSDTFSERTQFYLMIAADDYHFSLRERLMRVAWASSIGINQSLQVSFQILYVICNFFIYCFQNRFFTYLQWRFH
jgi:hypothetical protein